ncbi:hypothetical protein DFH06DRAFT_483877 [Mycena polygramma]|nr:hypothetical protein DFH06DRAFT_483877 [Mycena polygramma]
MAQKRLLPIPVLTLPNELICEIFAHFLPPYPSCPPLSGPLSPTTLIGICRQWRTIALSMPALWRAMSLEFMHEPEDQIEMMKVWLERSGASPLSFQTDERYICDVEVLSVIAAHRARWEYVKLNMNLFDFHAIEGAMPMLRQLELQVPIDGVPSFPVAFHAPLLRAATLWDFEYHTALLPWSQLTSLVLIAKVPRHCREILQQTPNLVYCELILLDYEAAPQPDVYLPNLKTLILVHFADNDPPARHILGSLIVPALRTLQIPELFLTPDPLGKLASFISKSGCHLPGLGLRITGPRALSKTSYQKAFPSLSKLVFKKELVDWFTSRQDQVETQGRPLSDFDSFLADDS